MFSTSVIVNDSFPVLLSKTLFYFSAGQAFPYTGSPRYTRLGEPDELMFNEEYARELLGKLCYFSLFVEISNLKSLSLIQ